MSIGTERRRSSNVQLFPSLSADGRGGALTSRSALGCDGGRARAYGHDSAHAAGEPAGDAGRGGRGRLVLHRPVAGGVGRPPDVVEGFHGRGPNEAGGRERPDGAGARPFGSPRRSRSPSRWALRRRRCRRRRLRPLPARWSINQPVTHTRPLVATDKRAIAKRRE